MYHQMPGLHLDVPFFQQVGAQPRDDRVPKLQSPGKHCEECTYLPLWRELEIDVVRVVDEW